MEGRLGYVLPAVEIYGTYSDGSNYESGSGSGNYSSLGNYSMDVGIGYVMETRTLSIEFF